MRKCCCCISVHAGAFVLGLLGALMAAAELATLVPFLLDLDGFNPIRDNLEHFFYIVETMIEEGKLDGEGADEALAFIREWIHPAMAVETGLCALYLACCLAMMAGVTCAKSRCLVVPYLVVQMILLIVCIAAGGAATAFLFAAGSLVPAVIALFVVLMAAVFFCYLWWVVKAAHRELGAEREYMYSPAPLKPIYSPQHDHRYQPSAPQQFNME